MGEKINPELELAINSDAYTPGSNLYLGYDKTRDEWTLIIRHSGEIDDLEGTLVNESVYLLGGFAVIKIYTYNIYYLQLDPRILYIDKASYYSYGAERGTTAPEQNTYARYAACLTDSQVGVMPVYGDGVCIGVIDSGLDIRNEEFCRDGRTRLLPAAIDVTSAPCVLITSPVFLPLAISSSSSSLSYILPIIYLFPDSFS